MTSLKNEREEFIAVLCQERPDIPVYLNADTARRILRDAQRLTTIAVRQCNGIADEEEEARVERTKAKAEDRIRELAGHFGAMAHFQGDPRGAVVKLALKSGISNSWGGEKLFCVPAKG